jgi:hypothetical protein
MRVPEALEEFMPILTLLLVAETPASMVTAPE